MAVDASLASAGTAALASDGPTGVDAGAGDVNAENLHNGSTPSEIEHEPEVAAAPEAVVPEPSEQEVANAQDEVDSAFM